MDLSQAYQQILLDDESKHYVTINIHMGLYQYTRLPFGVASAPAIFQKAMDLILQGLPGVICYIDDILVSGRTEEEQLFRLEEVLKRLKSYGLRVKKNKCAFIKESVEYLGHKVDASGLHPLSSKVEAITQAPEPQNVQQLRSFLGLLNYYGKFINNLATLLHPLNKLLQQNVKWCWSQECQMAFKQAKQKLVSSKVLAHYDIKLPIKLAADASSYGVGAVISHVYPDGTERPIAFASRTLTMAEQNYAQLEKEALGLVFGVKRFHPYLFGRSFTLVTDHRPLMTILGPKTGIPSLAAARLQRWAIVLSAYQYDIEFKRTAAHANADGLSRLPLPVTGTGDSIGVDVDVFNIAQIEALPVTFDQLEQATRRDVDLSQVWQYVQLGWPDVVQERLKPYSIRRDELTLQGNVLMWGIRVIVPNKLQDKVLSELHREHPGVVRMKSIARSYVWWPGLDQTIESVVKACSQCQVVKNTAPVAPLHPWIWPAQPWQRIHIDFAGPFMGKLFLLVVDAHSKWPEVREMKSTTAARTIEVLRQLFASHGLPEQVVSDNGPQFTAEEFAAFMKVNGIKHIRSTPYHPSTNGLVERFVQTFKRAMRAGESEGKSMEHRLANFLLTYRSTPHATTNVAPCDLFLKRHLRTRFDLLRPDRNREVSSKQAMYKKEHDVHSKLQEFFVGNHVLAKNFLNEGDKWIPGVVVERKGPLSYIVQIQTGAQWRRHVDQLRDGSGLGEGNWTKTRQDVITQGMVPESSCKPTEAVQVPASPGKQTEVVQVPTQPCKQPEVVQMSPASSNNPLPILPPEAPEVEVSEEPRSSTTLDRSETLPTSRRYPQRNRQPPQRFGFKGGGSVVYE